MLISLKMDKVEVAGWLLILNSRRKGLLLNKVYFQPRNVWCAVFGPAVLQQRY